MKLQFSTSDSIYSIFKKLKKVPSYKKVYVYIDPQHEIFTHTRRAKQLQETIQKHDLDVTFMITSPSMQQFFAGSELQTHFQYTHILNKWGKQLHDFFLQTQKLHTSLIFRQSYVSYLVVLAEVSVLALILYLFWGLISPNVTITITPAHVIEPITYNYRYVPYTPKQQPSATTQRETEHISIPLYMGELPYEHTMNLNVQNVTYTYTAASGTVILYNTRDEAYSLVANTTLITSDGLLFSLPESVDLPAGTVDDPSTTIARIVAKEMTEDGAMIGEEGNLPKGTRLTIKNLPESRDLEQLYAEVRYGLGGGSATTKGSVIADDIEQIEKSIIEYMRIHMREELQKFALKEKDRVIFFNDDYITLDIQEFVTTSNIGDVTSFVQGEVKTYIRYKYIKKADIKKAVQTFLEQRPSANRQVLSYDFGSLTMYDVHEEVGSGTLYIPTSINIIWGYDFQEDVNKLVPEMKAKIAGTSKKEAKSILLGYEEIKDVDIAISPPWYNTLPDAQVRIKFRVATSTR